MLGVEWQKSRCSVSLLEFSPCMANDPSDITVVIYVLPLCCSDSSSSLDDSLLLFLSVPLDWSSTIPIAIVQCRHLHPGPQVVPILRHLQRLCCIHLCRNSPLSDRAPVF